MKYILYISALALVYITTSCNEWNLFSDSTQVQKTFETAESFHEIHIDGIFNVELEQNQNPGVIIKGTRDQIQATQAFIEEGILYVKANSIQQWRSDYGKASLTITVDSLSKLWSYKPIHLYSRDTIQSNKLWIYLIGELSESDLTVKANYFRFVNAETSTGKYHLTGKVEQFSCRLRGTGHLEARALKARRVHFTQESLGDAYVYAEQNLEAIFNSTGNIYYSGSPSDIYKEANSSGKLIPLE